jgi:hypothetical protein
VENDTTRFSTNPTAAGNLNTLRNIGLKPTREEEGSLEAVTHGKEAARIEMKKAIKQGLTYEGFKIGIKQGIEGGSVKVPNIVRPKGPAPFL